MKLSVVIPARNEEFLARTIQDILEHSEAETEVIAVLDGAWATPEIPQHPRVNVIYVPESIGQIAATNLGARLAKGKYIAKVDAHCTFDQGWDRKMIEEFEKQEGHVVMVPIMRNLHAFDWKCMHCGWKKYQGPTPTECANCKKTDRLKKKMVWKGKSNPQSVSYCFDSEPHFQYFNEYKHRKEYQEQLKTGLTETMSLQGSFFMSTLEDFWRLKLSDEAMGSWGNQGIEVACKMWLSGGRVLCNHKTWYAHLFRTKPGVFGFPYHNPESKIRETKSKIREAVFTGKLPHQIYPVSWLVEKFWPVPGWTENDLERVKQGTL